MNNDFALDTVQINHIKVPFLDYLQKIPIEPQNYKLLEELSKERGNISIEECLQQIMEEEMMREMLKEVNPYYRELMDKFDEKARKWWKENGDRANNEDIYKE